MWHCNWSSVVCLSQALFTRDDDTSDEEEADTEEPDMIAADELAGSKQR